MTQADLFIEKYKQLEKVVRETYGIKHEESISYCLTHQGKFQKYKDDIRYCQDVRNWLQHNRKINSEFAISPNEAVIQFIESLIQRIQNRPRCIDIAIKIDSVYTETLSGSVKNTILKMREHLYTHIPIVADNVVIGVFDENSIFNYLATEQIIGIDDPLTFNDIRNYLRLDDREMEDFEFVSCNMYLDELEDKFETSFRKGKRIGMVFDE